MHGSTAYSQTDLDVPVGLSQGGLPELVGAEDVKEAHVEVVEVWLDGGSLHDQVLCHPGIVLFPNQADEFLHLGSEKVKKKKKRWGRRKGGRGGRRRRKEEGRRRRRNRREDSDSDCVQRSKTHQSDVPSPGG